ncbi:TPA: AbrB family transcriptional regulator [Providencia alcalifaciens]|nr:AbrB family transcriptional regulator [Providencia alcalifaciens]
MKTKVIAAFKDPTNQLADLPKHIDFEDANELKINREVGCIILSSAKRDWLSLRNEVKADKYFLLERATVIKD